ncbi:MAG TPA: MmgE/PrpD family protein [Terriglobales bacterium]|nr:MmgE/PrpD family protein [Terriglobales bacterium]
MHVLLSVMDDSLLKIPLAWNMVALEAKTTMTCIENLAEFVSRVKYEDLGKEAKEQLKVRILDAIGCAIGAIEAQTVQRIREHTCEFDHGNHCALIGGGSAAPDRAAFYNGALVRYLDFNDSYLAKGETCHPSDNLAPVLAATEYAKGRGRDLLTALAVAYQVQCRLSEAAPVRAAGFDHTTQGSYAVAAGVSKALRLTPEQTANALAICGTAFNALRVTRTGKLSNWKGLAYPNTAACCTNAVFLARQGITGPLEVIEGEKGFMDAIAGMFEVDWSREALDRVPATILKKYNAEIHSQTAIEAALSLKTEHRFDVREIESINVEIFDVAFHIIGGGDEGDKMQVRSKEEADHSLPYLIAVALLDGQVMPEQYQPERIIRNGVQQLLRRITIRPSDDYSARFPKEMPCRLTVSLRNGKSVSVECKDYPGFITRPMTWDDAFKKFEELASPHTSPELRRSISDSIHHLERIEVAALTRLLSDIRCSPESQHPGAMKNKECRVCH